MDPADEYDYTVTGIPLGYHYQSISDIPIDVRPVVNTKPVSDYPKGPTGRRGLGPRMGRDRTTYWCLSCDTAVATPTKTWCARCENKRNAAGRRASRAAEAGRPTEVTFPVDTLNQLVDLSDAVIDRIGDATLEFDRPHMTGGAIDDLMHATKDLANYLTMAIRPKVRSANFRTVTPAEVRRSNNRPTSPPRRNSPN